MQASFLSELASQIISRHGQHLDRVQIVLPSKRAGLFLHNEITKQIGGPCWLPEVLGFDDYVLNETELAQPDPVILCCEFFISCLQDQEDESFDKAATWIPTLISDFNDIDLALGDPEQLFKNVTAARKLEEWNPDGSEATETQLDYLKFWERLDTYYHTFKSHLKQKGYAYRGMYYREAADNMLKGEWQRPDHIDVIVFAGLNALTTAGETIIKATKSQIQTEIYWDMDAYLYDQPDHEASRFIRRNISALGNDFPKLFDSLREEKEIEVIASMGKVGQAKVCAALLEKHKDQLNNTVVVVGDERILDPLLSSLGTDLGAYNITMGYPLTHHAATSFVQAFLQLISRRDHYFNGSYHHSDLVAWLTHPLSAKVLDLSQVNGAITEIRKNNITFLGDKILNERFGFLAPWLSSSNTRSVGDTIELVSKLLLLIADTDRNNQILISVCARLLSLLKEIDTYASHYAELISSPSIGPIFQRLIQGSVLSFSGEPLEGLQIMGMLESRTLDFEYLIVLGMNEGVIPQGKTANSFIPYDLKVGHGINTYRENDSIFAYHFYRLISRCKHAYLLYDPNPEDYGNAEVSRFVTQLKFEPIGNIKIKESVYQNPAVLPDQTDITIQAKDYTQRAEEMLEERISQSGLNTFINCPRDFYYKYILKLREDDEVEESLEDRTFGNILHQCLEDIYTPFLGQQIDAEQLKARLSKLSEIVNIRYHEEIKLAEGSYGENLISRHVIEDYIERFVKWEAQEIKKEPRKLISLEYEASMEFQYATGKKATMFGIIDRIEERPSGLYVIDYKSGKVDSKFTGGAEISPLFEKPELSKALQLLVYGLFAQSEFNRSDIKLGWYSFRELSKGLIPLTVQKTNDISAIDMEAFKAGLSGLLNRIVDPELELTHNPDSKYCDFCMG